MNEVDFPPGSKCLSKEVKQQARGCPIQIWQRRRWPSIMLISPMAYGLSLVTANRPGGYALMLHLYHIRGQTSGIRTKGDSAKNETRMLAPKRYRRTEQLAAAAA